MFAAHIEVVPFGPPQVGFWCERCNRPSLIRQEFRAVFGLSFSELPSFDFCMDCDNEEEVEDLP